MKNIFKNISLLIKNIKNYGIIVFIKTLLYELFYSFKFLDFKILKFDLKKNDNYLLTKTSNSYSTPDIPTPYFFLRIVKNFLIKNRITKFDLCDLGCGDGRVGMFFDKFFKINFIGIDINSKLIRDNKIKFLNKKNFFFYRKNLQKIKSKNDISLYFNKKKNHENFLIFCSDPFDSQSILYLLKLYKLRDSNNFFLMINQKNLKEFRKFKILEQFFFRNKKRNITLFKL